MIRRFWSCRNENEIYIAGIATSSLKMATDLSVPSSNGLEKTFTISLENHTRKVGQWLDGKAFGAYSAAITR